MRILLFASAFVVLACVGILIAVLVAHAMKRRQNDDQDNYPRRR